MLSVGLVVALAFVVGFFEFVCLVFWFFLVSWLNISWSHF